MTFEISQENAQKVLDYLTRKPYAEVYDLIPILTNLKLINKTMNPEETPVQEPAVEPTPETDVVQPTEA